MNDLSDTTISDAKEAASEKAEEVKAATKNYANNFVGWVDSWDVNTKLLAVGAGAVVASLILRRFGARRPVTIKANTLVLTEVPTTTGVPL